MKTHSLNLPAEENVKPVDYILYDLVEGVTLIVVNELWSAQNKGHNYPYVYVRLRTVDHRGARIEAPPSVPTGSS